MAGPEAQNFGDVAPLVTATTCLVSAGWALTFSVFGRNGFFPNGEPYGFIVRRIGVLISVLGLAYVFYSLTDPDQARKVSGLLLPAAFLMLFLLLAYVYFHSILVHDRWL